MIYSMMFPRDPADDRPGPCCGQTALLPLAEGPCPSCPAFPDQLDGVAEHASQRVNPYLALPRIHRSTASLAAVRQNWITIGDVSLTNECIVAVLDHERIAIWGRSISMDSAPSSGAAGDGATPAPRC